MNLAAKVGLLMGVKPTLKPTSIVHLSASELNRKSARFLVFTQPTVKRLWLTRPRVPLPFLSPLSLILTNIVPRYGTTCTPSPLYQIATKRTNFRLMLSTGFGFIVGTPLNQNDGDISVQRRILIRGELFLIRNELKKKKERKGEREKFLLKFQRSSVFFGIKFYYAS